MSHRSTNLVIREVLGNERRIVLDFACRCAQLVGLGVIVEVNQANIQVFPVFASGNQHELILAELLKVRTLTIGDATAAEAGLNPVHDTIAMGVPLVETFVLAAQTLQRLGNLTNSLVVSAGVYHRFDRLVFKHNCVPLAAADINVKVLELHGGRGRKNDISEHSVVLHPWMLNE